MTKLSHWRFGPPLGHSRDGTERRVECYAEAKMTVLAVALAIVAALCDLRKREIPNGIPGLLIVSAIVATAVGSSHVNWTGLACGALLGLAITLPIYFLGGLGGGDVKLVVALGAALGPGSLLSALFWVAMCGGMLAVVALIRGRRDFAYAPAIAMGLLIYWIQLELAGHASA
jgi:Flp pilus assembly protein protease CpaA